MPHPCPIPRGKLPGRQPSPSGCEDVRPHRNGSFSSWACSFLEFTIRSSDTPSPTGSTSPGLPEISRSIRAWIRARARRSRRPSNHDANTSVWRTRSTVMKCSLLATLGQGSSQNVVASSRDVKWLMRRFLAALAALAFATATHASRYAVISLIGDEMLIVGAAQGTGQRIDRNSRTYVPLDDPVIDKTVLLAAKDALERTTGAEPVLLFGRDRRLYAMQQRLMTEGQGMEGLL